MSIEVLDGFFSAIEYFLMAAFGVGLLSLIFIGIYGFIEIILKKWAGRPIGKNYLGTLGAKGFLALPISKSIQEQRLAVAKRRMAGKLHLFFCDMRSAKIDHRGVLFLKDAENELIFNFLQNTDSALTIEKDVDFFNIALQCEWDDFPLEGWAKLSISMLIRYVDIMFFREEILKYLKRQNKFVFKAINNYICRSDWAAMRS